MYRRKFASSRPGRGFTLLEMVIVLLIISIAAAMVIPLVSGTAGMQARSAARMVMADLEYAQNQGIVTQGEVRVDYDATANSYSLSNTSAKLIHPITKKDYDVDFDTLAGFDRVSIDSVSFAGAKTVRFDALGAPDEAGTVTLVGGAEAYEVSVAAVTGTVTVAKSQ